VSPEEAADLAARTLAAIDARTFFLTVDYRAADRDRVASDLYGLRVCTRKDGRPRSQVIDLHAMFTANLRRTAALYGVAP
jgi:hypothetical protein